MQINTKKDRTAVGGRRTRKRDDKSVKLQMPLLDYLMYQVRPFILSDLCGMTEAEREQAARALEAVQPEQGTLEEWNDALTYLFQAGPERTARAARQKLITLLRGRAEEQE